ncbi:MAG: selenide, water dikinase SelD [Limnobacter sp.]|uniref:selenide, water dikinase SelD n=1 Tax=Limnobacter sp. TaxID=2003368 RepID=UPI003918F06E
MAMADTQEPVLRDIVLVGGGHSHVGVLRMFGMAPWPGVRLTLLCNDVDTPYSGMLPGYVAGHYAMDDVHIDLARLCAFAGARFIRAEVVGLDRQNKTVLCKGRPPIRYDVLSLNTGSTPDTTRVPGAAEHAIPVKPIAEFNQHWLKLLHQVQVHQGPLHIAVVGGGAGGVELCLAMHHRLSHEWQRLGHPAGSLSFEVITSGADILPTHNPRVRAHFRRVLTQRGIALRTGAKVMSIRTVDGRKQLDLNHQDRVTADTVMWVTQAHGPRWLADTGLQITERCFVHVTNTLQTTRDPDIFAAGDVAHFQNRPLEKAGVFAVRMGKPLAMNLHRHVQGKRLKEYKPQRTWLALISTGDQSAIASKGAFSAAGNWLWAWKDHIDRQFMQRFTELPSMPAPVHDRSGQSVPLSPEENLQAISALAMRCGGCGAKVGSTVLSRALAGLQPVQRPDVLVGLHAPDDAAIVRVPAGKAVVHTVDFFRAFIDDPYLFGRIAANHALGDVFAMGGQPQSATAVATVPPGLDSQVEELLFQMMSGAVDVLNAAGCALVGGHTGEGRELALGFAVNGLIDESLQQAMIKGGLRPGDVLILTKPIGTGTLMAALPQGKAKGRWVMAALDSMAQSSQAAAVCLQQHGSKACTDLTGFGLLGHLVEMTKPSGVEVELNMDALPLLNGALDTLRMGVLSSLQAANIRLRRAIRNPQGWVHDARYALLFDPQTAGGLLASVPEQHAAACIQALNSLGYTHAACIGRVLEPGEEPEPIVLKGIPTPP